MTKRERIEARLEKREEWAGKAQAASKRAFDAGRSATAGIPFGQPILVGHHSEKRHRAAIARSDRGYRKGVERGDMAAHHASKAAGIERQLDSTIYSDDENAIEALEAKIAGLEAERKQRRDLNRHYRKAKNAKTDKARKAAVAELATMGVTFERLEEQIDKSPSYDRKQPFPSNSLSNLGGRISAAKKRLEHVKVMQERTANADAAGGVAYERSPDSEYVSVTFAEKPARDVLDALRAAGFYWSGGSWHGKNDALPERLLNEQ